ncbi:MAG TPA: family 43 glycosylhydrolase [Terriglobales bacterium]|nr:family 43 glycosylhydrolase [Terriglobales bacterium]
MSSRHSAFAALLSICVTFAGCGGGTAPTTPVPPPPSIEVTTYTNPISPATSVNTTVESCPDPSIIYNSADKYWYLYCTGNPLNDTDKNGSQYRDHLITIHRSSNLSSWTYIGDALTTRPSWVASGAGAWAPDIEYLNGKYYLYYSVPNTTLPGGASAIAVATSSSPAGPWTHAPDPVVEPHKAQCCSESDRWTIDSDVIDYNGELYIYYGSFYGGISVRRLSADGFHSDPASEVQITVPDRYEAAQVVKHEGYFYLFASVSNCCNGPLTGYSVFVGRATTPTGPFLDRDGNSMLSARAGGSLVLSPNGDKWVGVGHNAVFTDFAGQDWTVYHAIDRTRPYFAGTTDTRRPAMLDPIDWVEGWPAVRGGFWASSTTQPRPAAQPGEPARYAMTHPPVVTIGAVDTARSDDFDSASIDPKWSWVRPPTSGVRMNGSALEFDTQSAELFENTNSASILSQAAPSGDYILETKLRLTVPEAGCCFNYTQAGLLVFAGDDNYLKLVHASIGWSRQIEFGKEMFPVTTGYPRYGSMSLEAPGDWTYLRIWKRTISGEERYTAFSSRDGQTWTQGGTWTHNLGITARFGLVSMSLAGYTAVFDYVRVYAVNPSTYSVV